MTLHGRLDSLLYGGISESTVLEIVGPSASGKTQVYAVNDPQKISFLSVLLMLKGGLGPLVFSGLSPIGSICFIA